MVKSPEIILYQLDSELEALYDHTIQTLRDELTFYRYQAIKYLVPEKKKKYKNAELASLQLKHIMKTLLVKRLDSSFYAFRKSLERFTQATANMVKMFDDNRIFIAPNVDVNRYIEEDREEEQKNEYNILISTEVLAEGVNMHRANVIVNYDMPSQRG